MSILIKCELTLAKLVVRMLSMGAITSHASGILSMHAEQRTLYIRDNGDAVIFYDC